MRFSYLDYSRDLLSSTIDNYPPRVYVFDNYKNRQQAETIYEPPVLEKQSLFLTMSELKEKLYPPERLVLKEEKLTVILYELMNDRQRSLLGIENYFDVIDLAGDFFHFYNELQEYKVKQEDKIQMMGHMRDWQREKFSIFQDLRRKYLDYLRDSGYTDKILSLRQSGFDTHFFRDYREFVFINIVDFSPREQELLEKLEQENKDVQLYLQVNPGDFDEEQLTLTSVTPPRNPQTELRLYHTSEDLLQLVDVLHRLEGLDEPEQTQTALLDADFKNSNYHRLLSPQKIDVDRDPGFTRTRIFRFINSLYQLLVNAEREGGHLRLRLEDLIKACNRREFRDYYRLENQDIHELNRLAAEDYTYFDSELVDRGWARLLLIVRDIEKISRFRNLKEFINFLEDLDLGVLNDSHFKNNHLQYFDALAELKSLADMGLVTSWGEYFENRTQGLFRLIINYLRYKKVKKVTEKGERPKIEGLSDAPHLSRSRLFVLNANNGVLPAPPAKDFLLTENQRQQLGLPVNRDRRLQEKYNFYRHLFSSHRAVVFSLENTEENRTASPFVEELKLNYGLTSRELSVQAGDYARVISRIFPDGESAGDYLRKSNCQPDSLKIAADDFPDRGFPLGYYKYQGLKDCYYRFYLEHIAGLEQEWPEFDRKLSRKLLGTLVHEMFEEVITDLRPRLKAGEFRPEPAIIEQVVQEKLDNYKLKIPTYFLGYYQQIVIPRIQQSIQAFFELLKRKVGDSPDRVLTEWSPDRYHELLVHELTSFYLSGRIDLLIESGDRVHLIDFKTGSSNFQQLDFYALLLGQGLSEDYQLSKYFYLVMDERLQEGFGDPGQLKQKLREELESFVNSEQYTAVYKSRCKDCSYRDICRVVIS